MSPPITLPVDEVVEELTAAVESRRRAVLHAPPGAGKTTRVPPALLRAEWLDGRVVMLEPRRVAARSAAARIAAELGSRVGDLVGYRVRNDTKVGKVDSELLMKLVQQHVGRAHTLILAVAGNALKAFPGAQGRRQVRRVVAVQHQT